MSELPFPTHPVAALDEPAPAAAAPGAAAEPTAAVAVPMKAAAAHPWPWLSVALVVMAVLVGVSLAIAWRTQQRLNSVEQELVARQRSGSDQSSEARLLAQQAQDAARQATARLSLVEARLGEVVAQRGQLEELIGAVSRPREESLTAEIDAAIRMALQQGAVSGSAEPLVLALRQAEERLGRQRQPRLEPLRRAIGRDLERVRGGGSSDMATLTGKIDEAIRMVDELPLLAASGGQASDERVSAPGPRGDVALQAAPAALATGWWPSWIGSELWRSAIARVWSELRSLVRVTRIDQPDAMLLAPDQAFFLRENLKLRLLNARLALLGRQFDAARSDLQSAEGWLQRYFDASSRRTRLVVDSLRQVATQAHVGSVARPDDTLAALAALAAVSASR